jgi:hypothetical protein
MQDNQMATPQRSTLDRRRVTAARACLVAGCPCKDPRIVSHRRAAFFAAVAREHGETANRTVAPDPEWAIPSLSI